MSGLKDIVKTDNLLEDTFTSVGERNSLKRQENDQKHLA